MFGLRIGARRVCDPSVIRMCGQEYRCMSCSFRRLVWNPMKTPSVRACADHAAAVAKTGPVGDLLAAKYHRRSRRQEFSTRLDRRQCVAEARKRPRIFQKNGAGPII